MAKACVVLTDHNPSHEKINGHCELTVSSRRPQWSRLRGPTITAQSRLEEVTAQSRRGHSSVTAGSQLSHGEVTAQSHHLQYDHDSVTARSQLNHGPGHGSVMAGCDHFGHGELTVSSQWANNEQSLWPIFFSWACLVLAAAALSKGQSHLATGVELHDAWEIFWANDSQIHLQRCLIRDKHYQRLQATVTARRQHSH